MVMSWLTNSMTTYIPENFLPYNTEKDTWDAEMDTYSCKHDTAELFEIESLLHDLKQGDTLVTLFYHSLATGSNWICLRSMTISARAMKHATKRLLKRMHFLIDPTTITSTTLMPSHCRFIVGRNIKSVYTILRY